MICRHKEFKVLENKNYKECIVCGIWKGERSDPHNYNGNYYHKNNTIVDGIPQRQWYWGIHKTVWDLMKIDLNTLERVLEFGCGIGLLLWTIYRKYEIQCLGVEKSFWAYNWQKEVYGFDKSYQVLNLNIEQTANNKLREFVNYEGKEYGFDFIYSCHVLEHLQDPMTIIERCYDLLNSNGIFYMVVPDKYHQKTLHTHLWTYDKNCIKLWLTQVGFKDIKIIKTKPYNPPPQNKDYPGHYLHICGIKNGTN